MQTLDEIVVKHQLTKVTSFMKSAYGIILIAYVKVSVMSTFCSVQVSPLSFVLHNLHAVVV